MKKNAVQQSLQAKLKLNSLSFPQLKEGITECFILTNRNFLQRRMKEAPISEIDTTTRELVSQVFAENNVLASYTSLQDLRQACQILDTQLGFEKNAELSQRHQMIIKRLFELASAKKEQ